MVKIYNDYDEEPEDFFHPLPAPLSCDFYDLEMNSYREDSLFWNSVLPHRGPILELGCGSGRISRQISSPTRPVVGIDLSMDMLYLAKLRQDPFCSYLCMDMGQLAFNSRFESILIPYNTLNLLTSRTQISSCLDDCRSLLSRGNTLAVQLYIPSVDFCQKKKKTFQFQMFNRPGGGRIIKEILKLYQPDEQLIEIEERFRIRPMSPDTPNRDYNTIYQIQGLAGEQWLSMFKESGFTLQKSFGDFRASPFIPSESTSFIAVFN
ncbi:MAG: class I SAM-dependent methyltransferase [Desulfobulbaceae bacterium]|nr:class I SAM-dependent methyltransferase [Desulfobulbaceae bacterium]